MSGMKTMALMENLGQIQKFVDQQLQNAGCPEKTRIQVEMAVEEIYVNIVEYAYVPETGEVEICCDLSREPLQLVIEFRDGGKPFDPLAHPEANIGASAEAREIGGLGIFMTRKLMDEAEYRYENGKNILTLKKAWDDKSV